MSEKEKRMSQEKWLTYYDEIIKNEKRALDFAQANENNLLRSLSIEKYSQRYLYASRRNRQNENTLPAGQVSQIRFADQENNRIADATIYLLNTSDKTYSMQTGKFGLENNTLFIPEKWSIVVITRDGNIGAISATRLASLMNSGKEEVTIPLYLFDKNLHTLSEVRNELGIQ